MVVTERFVYLATPRTASRSVEQAVLSSSETVVYKSKQHHAPVPEVTEKLRQHEGKPVYTVVREPTRQALSWYYHAKGHLSRDFTDFIKKYKNGWLFGNHVNIYLNVPDTKITFLPFEHGINTVLEYMGLSNTDAPFIGQTEAGGRVLSETEEHHVRNRFRYDFPLHTSALNGPVAHNTTEFVLAHR